MVENKRLGDALTFQRGFDITKKNQRIGDVPIVSSSGIHSYHNNAKAKGPGIVIGRKGTLGTVHYIRGNYWPHDTTLWVKEFKGTSPEYLRYFLPSLKLEFFDVGASNPTLNRNHLHKLQVKISPPKDQQKIAAILTAYDDLIENNRQRVALLEKMTEEIYREWFVRLRFPGHEHTSVHKGVPEGWEQKPLPDCIAVKPPEPNVAQERYPFVGMDRLSTSSAFFSIDEFRSAPSGPRFRNDDVLLPRITPCLENGKRALVTGLKDGEVASGSTEFIVLRGKTLPSESVYCLSISEGLRKHAENSMVGASGRQRVHEGCLNWVLIKHPPKALLDHFSALVSPMYETAKRLLDQNDLCVQTRDLLLNRLISGKLRVDDLDIQFPPSMQA